MPQVNKQKEQNKLQAQALLDNPVFIQISEQLDTQYYQRWSDNMDEVQRHELWHQANAIREFLGMVKHLATQKVEYDH